MVEVEAKIEFTVEDGLYVHQRVQLGSGCLGGGYRVQMVELKVWVGVSRDQCDVNDPDVEMGKPGVSNDDFEAEDVEMQHEGVAEVEDADMDVDVEN